MKFERIDLMATQKDKCTVLLAQPSISVEQFTKDNDGLWRLQLNACDYLFIKTVLSKAADLEADLIVFPELSIPKCNHAEIKTWSDTHKDVLIIAGSDYIAHHNTATIYFNGKAYQTEKLYPSKHEGSIMHDVGIQCRAGHQSYFVNTPIGNLGILICSDLFAEQTHGISHNILSLNLDILCVIACQSEPIEHYQKINQWVQDSRKGMYVFYSNLHCPPDGMGRSAVFSYELSKTHQEFIDRGMITSDDYKQKQIVLESSGNACLVFDCSLPARKASPGSRDESPGLLHNVRSPFLFNGSTLVESSYSDSFLPEMTSSIGIYETNQSEYDSRPKTNTEEAVAKIQYYCRRQLIGRDADIANVYTDLIKRRAVVLHGIAGLGKTALANRVILKFWESHTDRAEILYVSLRDARDYSTLIEKLGDCLHLPPGERTPKNIERNLTILSFKSPVLICLDNFEDIERHERIDSLRYDFSDILQFNNTYILMTHQEEYNSTIFKPYKLNPLQPSDSRALFKRIREEQGVRDDLDDGLLDQLIEILQGHAFTIILEATRKEPLDVILVDWKKYQNDMSFHELHSGDYSIRTLNKAIESSFLRIKEDYTACLIWGYMSLVPGRIPEPLLKSLFANRPRELRENMNRLCKAHLVDKVYFANEEGEKTTEYEMLMPVKRQIFNYKFEGNKNFGSDLEMICMSTLYDYYFLNLSESKVTSNNWLHNHNIVASMIDEIFYLFNRILFSPDFEGKYEKLKEMYYKLRQYFVYNVNEAISMLKEYIHHLRSFSNIAAQNDNELLCADINRVIADLYRLHLNKNSAVNYYKEADKVLSRSNGIEAAQLNLSYGNYFRGESALKSEERYKTALSYFTDIRENCIERVESIWHRATVGMADTLQGMGALQSRLCEFDSVFTSYKQAKNLYAEADDMVGKGYIEMRIGINHMRLGVSEINKAFYHFDRARDILSAIKNPLYTADIDIYVGDCLRHTKDYSKSIKTLTDALSVFLDKGRNNGIAHAYLRLGLVYLESKSYKGVVKGKGYLDEAEKRFRDNLALGNVWQGIGDYYAMNGKKFYKKAIDAYYKSEEFFERAADKIGRLKTLNKLVEFVGVSETRDILEKTTELKEYIALKNPGRIIDDFLPGMGALENHTIYV